MARKHCQLGNRWTTIAKCVAGRTECEVKNHWNSTLRCKTSNKTCRPFYIYASMCSQDICETPASRLHAFQVAYGTTPEASAPAGRLRQKPTSAAAAAAAASLMDEGAALGADEGEAGGSVRRIKHVGKSRLVSRRLAASRSSSSSQLAEVEAELPAPAAAADQHLDKLLEEPGRDRRSALPLRAAAAAARRKWEVSSDEEEDLADISEEEEEAEQEEEEEQEEQAAAQQAIHLLQEAEEKVAILKEAARKLQTQSTWPHQAPGAYRGPVPLQTRGILSPLSQQPPSSSASPESCLVGLNGLRPVCVRPPCGPCAMSSTPLTATCSSRSTRSTTAGLDQDLQMYLSGLPLTKDPSFIVDLAPGMGPAPDKPAAGNSAAFSVPHVPAAGAGHSTMGQEPPVQWLPQAQTLGLPQNPDLDLASRNDLQEFRGWLMDLQREGDGGMQVRRQELPEQQQQQQLDHEHMLWRPVKRQRLASSVGSVDGTHSSFRDQGPRSGLLPAPVPAPLAAPIKEELASLHRLTPGLHDLGLFDFAMTPPPHDLPALPAGQAAAAGGAAHMELDQLLGPLVPGACLDAKQEPLLPAQLPSLEPTAACQVPSSLQPIPSSPWPAPQSMQAIHPGQQEQLNCQIPFASGPTDGSVHRTSSCASWEDEMDNLLCHAAAAAWLM